MEVGPENIMPPPHQLLSDPAEADPPVVKLFLDGAGQCAMELSLPGLVQGLWDMVSKALQGNVIVTLDAALES